MTYKAPVAEQLFVLDTIADCSGLGVPLISVPKVPVLGPQKHGQKCRAHR
jgi:hypothetical protein